MQAAAGPKHWIWSDWMPLMSLKPRDGFWILESKEKTLRSSMGDKGGRHCLSTCFIHKAGMTILAILHIRGCRVSVCSVPRPCLSSPAVGSSIASGI